MKIAILAVGTNIHAERWVNALSQRGLEVLLLTQEVPVPGRYRSDVRVVLLPFTGMAGYALNAFAVWRICRRERVALLHAHYAGGCGVTALLSQVRPYVVSVWGGDVYDVPQRSWLHRRLILAVLSAAALITSTSRTMAEKVRSFGIPVPLAVIPFGIDTALFSKSHQHPDNEFAQRPLVVGTVKTLTPKYGIDTLIEAFAIACRTPGFAQAAPLLRIAGSGPQRQVYQQLARRLAISDKVEFCGQIPHGNVPEMLRSFDIFVAASRLDSESFGVAVIEASACGLPVVVSDAGGLPEVVEHGVTGLVVPRDRPDLFAAALVQLASTPEYRCALGARGAAQVSQQYQWRDCVDRMIEKYTEIIPQPEKGNGDAKSARSASVH